MSDSINNQNSSASSSQEPKQPIPNGRIQHLSNNSSNITPIGGYNHGIRSFDCTHLFGDPPDRPNLPPKTN